MTIIACTKAMLDLAGIQPEQAPEGNYEPKFVWYAHVFVAGRRKCVLFVNELTYYQFVLYGVRQEHLARIGEVFLDNLALNLRAGGFEPDETEALIGQTSESIRFTKTFNRSLVGSMNDLAAQARHWIESGYAHTKEFNSIPFNQRANGWPVLKLEDSYPRVAMARILSTGDNPTAVVAPKKEKASVEPLDEFTKARVVKAIEELIDRRYPKYIRHELTLVYTIKSNKVTIMEDRPAYIGQGRVQFDVAQFRREDGRWTVYWRDSRDKWHKVTDLEPHEDFVHQLKQVEADNRGLFWG